MSLVQVTKRQGTIERVQRGVTPVLELDLDEHQYIASVALEQVVQYLSDRKTVDWKWIAYVVTPLGDA